MDDDDPFAVVAPSEKKMSSYLKKSMKDFSSPAGGKCVETSSHASNSTRSTTNSTHVSEDSSNLFPSAHKSSRDPFSKKSTNNSTSGFNNSSSSGSADFDFGNGLEFGHGFGGSSGFGDDGFGIPAPSSGGVKSNHDRKAQSSRNLSSAPGPFLDAPPPPQSMRNFSSANDFDAFGADPFKDIDDGFAPFEVQTDVKFGDDHDGYGMDAFGSTGDMDDRKRDGFQQSARSKSGDLHKKAVSSSKRRGGIPRRAHSSNDGRLPDPEDVGPSPRTMSRKNSSDKSPQMSSKGRDRSDHSPVRRTRSGRRATMDHSGHTEVSEAKSQNSEPPRRRPLRRGSVGYTSSDGSLEPANLNKPGHAEVSEAKSQNSEPPRRRPLRRGSVGYTSSDGSLEPANLNKPGHAEVSEAKSQNSEPPRRRPLRRGSVGYTYSDGSLEPANLNKPPPARSKSSAGPGAGPPGRRQRRASVTHTSSGSLAFMAGIVTKKEDGGDNTDVDWDHEERAKSQQEIMDMYRGGGLSSKSEVKNEASLGDISKHIDLMGLANEQNSGHDSGHGSRGKIRRGGKKKDKETEDDGYKEPKDRKDRTKGSLLDRVVGDMSEVPSKSGHESHESNGLSYSERIMMAQQRSKRNL